MASYTYQVPTKARTYQISATVTGGPSAQSTVIAVPGPYVKLISLHGNGALVDGASHIFIAQKADEFGNPVIAGGWAGLFGLGEGGPVVVSTTSIRIPGSFGSRQNSPRTEPGGASMPPPVVGMAQV